MGAVLLQIYFVPLPVRSFGPEHGKQDGRLHRRANSCELKLFQGLAQTAMMDFPTVYRVHGSKTCENGTIHRSQKPSCAIVGIDCRSSNRLAVDATSPTESRYLNRISFKPGGKTSRKVERL